MTLKTRDVKYASSITTSNRDIIAGGTDFRNLLKNVNRIKPLSSEQPQKMTETEEKWKKSRMGQLTFGK